MVASQAGDRAVRPHGVGIRGEEGTTLNISSVAIGLTLVLSVTAFVLALWPAIADAPWEQAPATFEESQAIQVSSIH